jgi:hypothetical protein
MVVTITCNRPPVQMVLDVIIINSRLQYCSMLDCKDGFGDDSKYHNIIRDE